MLGVESFVDGAVVVRVTAKTEPGAQFQVARTLRAGLKQALDAANVRTGIPSMRPTTQ